MEKLLMEEDAFVGKWVRPNGDTPLEMVGRKGAHDLDWLAGYIIRFLGIRPDDTVLDVCCGNGLITARIAPKVKAITGLDHSQLLLKQAREISDAPNLTYAHADATRLDAAFDGQQFDKVLLCSGFQYFDEQVAKDVFAGLRAVVRPGGVVGIFEIPDKRWKLRHHVRAFARLLTPGNVGDGGSAARFPTVGARLAYLGRNVPSALMRKKTDDLGWWWSRADFAVAANAAGFECRTFDQPRQHPYHTYRFDAILR